MSRLSNETPENTTIASRYAKVAIIEAAGGHRTTRPTVNYSERRADRDDVQRRLFLSRFVDANPVAPRVAVFIVTRGSTPRVFILKFSSCQRLMTQGALAERLLDDTVARGGVTPPWQPHGRSLYCIPYGSLRLDVNNSPVLSRTRGELAFARRRASSVRSEKSLSKRTTMTTTTTTTTSFSVVATYARKSLNRARVFAADRSFVHSSPARSAFLRRTFITEPDRLDGIGCPPLNGYSRDRIEAFHQALPPLFCTLLFRPCVVSAGE